MHHFLYEKEFQYKNHVFGIKSRNVLRFVQRETSMTGGFKDRPEEENARFEAIAASLSGEDGAGDEPLHNLVASLSDDTDDHRQDSVAIHKLGVLSSHQFNRLLLINILLGAYIILHIFTVSVLCGTVWKRSKTTKNLEGEMFTYQTCKLDRTYMIVLYSVDQFGRALLIITAILFTIRIVFAKKQHKSEEQAWAVMMLCTTAISYTPALSIQIMHDHYIADNDRSRALNRFQWFIALIRWSRAVNLFFSSFGQLFYLWASAHSYSFLNVETDRPSRLRFYGPKLLLILSYGAFRLIIRLVFRLSPSKLPFVTFIAMIRNFYSLNHWPKKSVVAVSCYTMMEVMVCFAIGRRIYITSRVLKEAEYLKYRSKQIGFRFFMMQNVIGFSLFFIADCVIILLTPRDHAISKRLNVPYVHLLYNARLGPIPRLLNYATTIMTAYVNLPADSVGVMGWIRGSNVKADANRKPIALKLKGETSREDSSTLIFELLIKFFNLSYLAYGLKSGESSRKRCIEYIEEEGYTQEMSFEHEENHTTFLILSNGDSIIVAFRGTTDMEHAKTDVKLVMTNITDAIPSRKPKTGANAPILDSLLWKSAMIHKGFADAYKSVSDFILTEISQLLSTSARPVYLTGHSLGGALSTLCSLDILLSLGHSDVYVITFGSPRCGNIYWRKIYDSFLENYWRVAMRSDIVTTLPRLGYAHVGKRVALTNTGEIFLDPNAIEMMMWSSAGLGVTGHRVPA